MNQLWQYINLRFITLYFFLIVVAIFPAYEIVKLRGVSEITYSGRGEELYLLKEGDFIEQDIIYVGTGIKECFIYFEGNRTEGASGRAKVVLKQGKIDESMDIDLSGFTAGYYQKLFLNLGRFKNGIIHLTINVESLSNGIDVGCKYGTDNLIKGVDPAKINGVQLSGPLLLKYTINTRDDYEWKSSIIIIGIILLLLYIATYIMMNWQENRQNSIFLMFIAAATSFFVISLIYPTLTYEPMSWAESATDFYRYASERPITECLTLMEGGLYISTLPMIITLFAVRVMGVTIYSFYLTQIIAVLIICMCVAPLCLEYFNKFFSRKSRFVLVLFMSCYLLSPDDLTIINFTYMGGAFIILVLLYDFKEIKMQTYVLVILCIVLFCFSKMAFFVFFPIGLVYFMLFWKKTNYKKKIVIFITCVASLSEYLVSTYIKRVMDIKIDDRLALPGIGVMPKNVPILRIFEKSIYDLTLSVNSVLFHNFPLQNKFEMSVITIAGIVIVIIMCFRNIYLRSKYDLISRFILVMLAIAWGQCGINVFTFSSSASSYVNWDEVEAVSINRWHDFTYMAIITVVLSIIYAIKIYVKDLEEENDALNQKWKRIAEISRSGVFMFVVLIMINNYSQDFHTENRWTTKKLLLSDWVSYGKTLNNDRYSIRLDPDTWYYESENVERCVIDVSNIDNNLVLADMGVNLSNESIFQLYVKRSSLSTQIVKQPYYVELKDEMGNVLAKERQMNKDLDRVYIGFNFGDGISNVSEINFLYEDGEIAFIDESIAIMY